MKISSINNNFYKSKPNFGSNAKVTTFSDGTVVRNSTWLYRNCVNWDWLAMYMDFNFKDKEKVNVYNFACSDGTESYTLGIALNENLPLKTRNKFLPIIASDVDSEIIKVAKSHKINLSQNDILALGNHVRSNNNYFVDKAFPMNLRCPNTYDYNSYKVNSYLENSIIFTNKDIVSSLKDIKDEGNTVILCRNVFPYLKDDYIKEVVSLLNEKLKKKSLFILGDFDNISNIKNLILKTFEPIDQRNVFRKL